MVGYLFSFGKVIVLVSPGFWVLHRVHFRYLKFHHLFWGASNSLILHRSGFAWGASNYLILHRSGFSWGASNSLILHRSGFAWDVLWFFTGCKFV